MSLELLGLWAEIGFSGRALVGYLFEWGSEEQGQDVTSGCCLQTGQEQTRGSCVPVQSQAFPKRRF